MPTSPVRLPDEVGSSAAQPEFVARLLRNWMELEQLWAGAQMLVWPWGEVRKNSMMMLLILSGEAAWEVPVQLWNANFES